MLSIIFLASFFVIDFLSKLGARSPIGVEGADPVKSPAVVCMLAPSPRIAFVLRFVRFAARRFSEDVSFPTRPRYLSAVGLVEGVSPSVRGPGEIKEGQYYGRSTIGPRTMHTLGRCGGVAINRAERLSDILPFCGDNTV